MAIDFPLANVRLDISPQVRAAIDPGVVDDYTERMREDVQFPPVVLFFDGEWHYLADGHHRVRAAQRLERVAILADVRDGTATDALWFALGANRANGQRLTQSDKRHAIQLALTAWPERSAALIAEQVGCSPQYVTTIKAGMPTTCDRIVTRTGHVRLASAAAKEKARVDAAALLKAGTSVEEVCKQLRVGRETVTEIRRTLGLGANKTHAAVRERYEKVIAMAGSGHTSRQIAADLGYSEETVRTIARKLGVAVRADEITRGTHRHDSNRIVTRIVMDAENLIDGAQLIDYAALDRSQLAEWLRLLKKSRDHLSGFIRRLMQEQQHGEAA